MKKWKKMEELKKGTGQKIVFTYLIVIVILPLKILFIRLLE